jgi:CheY-like chemotaxis protein
MSRLFMDESGVSMIATQQFGLVIGCSLNAMDPLNATDANKVWHVTRDRLVFIRIVVVEDHDDARRYLGTFLRQLGANVVLARDAIQGIEAIKKNGPHLVVSDIKMPGADGFELLRQIRALGSDAGGGVPVIAMTGLGGQADRTRILNAGFQAFLPKPFTPERLLETILTILDR